MTSSQTYPIAIAISTSFVTDVDFTFATAIWRPGPRRYSRRASATHSGH